MNETTLGGLQLDGWTVVGLVGQFLFFMRFVVQWIATERARRTVIPRSFWYFSIAGSLILLLYSFVRRDPVFIVGYLLAMAIYLRNLKFAFLTDSEESAP